MRASSACLKIDIFCTLNEIHGQPSNGSPTTINDRLIRTLRVTVTVCVITELIPSVIVQYNCGEPLAMLVANPMISAARSAVTTNPIAASHDWPFTMR